jgi:hypothetical protein
LREVNREKPGFWVPFTLYPQSAKSIAHGVIRGKTQQIAFFDKARDKAGNAEGGEGYLVDS